MKEHIFRGPFCAVRFFAVLIFAVLIFAVLIFAVLDFAVRLFAARSQGRYWPRDRPGVCCRCWAEWFSSSTINPSFPHQTSPCSRCVIFLESSHVQRESFLRRTIMVEQTRLVDWMLRDVQSICWHYNKSWSMFLIPEATTI